MVAERCTSLTFVVMSCSLAKISMVAELNLDDIGANVCCSLAKISMVAEHKGDLAIARGSCSLAKISMVAEPQNI